MARTKRVSKARKGSIRGKGKGKRLPKGKGQRVRSKRVGKKRTKRSSKSSSRSNKRMRRSFIKKSRGRSRRSLRRMRGGSSEDKVRVRELMEVQAVLREAENAGVNEDPRYNEMLTKRTEQGSAYHDRFMEKMRRAIAVAEEKKAAASAEEREAAAATAAERVDLDRVLKEAHELGLTDHPKYQDILKNKGLNTRSVIKEVKRLFPYANQPAHKSLAHVPPGLLKTLQREADESWVTVGYAGLGPLRSPRQGGNRPLPPPPPPAPAPAGASATAAGAAAGSTPGA